MAFYRIIGSDGQVNLVNLRHVIIADFDDQHSRIVFDGILKITVPPHTFQKHRTHILKTMIKFL